MANVYDVAAFFIQLANQSEDDQMTNLKLNKLLYYAQGVALARTGKPLFDAPVEAWPLGPVVPEVYRRYKVCGKSPIPVVEEGIEPSRFTEDEYEALLDVMREFGQYTGSKLVTLTHKEGTPWSDAMAAGASVLSEQSMKQYFTEHPVPKFSETVKAPKVNALPADWYDPAEDAEWEAYL